MFTKTHVFTRMFKHVVCVCLCLWLWACGGGGSSVQINTKENNESTPDALDPAFTSRLPASDYAPDSELRHAFELLNQERIRCGFGRLVQNASLDASARAHADWMLRNNVLSHEESLGSQGFSGMDIAARVRAQSYPLGSGSAGEEYASKDTGTPEGWGFGAVRALLNAPYHLVAMTMPFQEMGVSLRQPSDVQQTGTGFRLVMNTGWSMSKANQQYLASGEVFTYPCNGATHVYYQLRNESPSPVPGRDLATQPLGSTVLIRVRSGDELTLNSATMTQRSSNQNVVLRSAVGGMTGTLDSNGLYDKSVAYVVADQPLSPNTDYSVVVAGSVRYLQNNGEWAQKAFTQTFTFTTAPAGMIGL